MFCFCSVQRTEMERAMRRIDRQGMVVIAFGWLVALAVTLTYYSLGRPGVASALSPGGG
jgi:hypothetical protein